MARHKKKIKEKKVSSDKIINHTLVRARNLRSSLLRRVSSPELKQSTPTVAILERWLQLPIFTCFYCLKALELSQVEVDHKTPLIRAGNNEINNLCTACSECNSIKGQMTEDEFRDLIQLINKWEDCGHYLLMRLKRGNMIFKR